MRKLILAVAVAVLLLSTLTTAAWAGPSSCPDGFHLHAIGDGNHEHEPHQHVGLSMDSVDLNGNGLICVKHLTPDGSIHVHIDDFIP